MKLRASTNQLKSLFSLTLSLVKKIISLRLKAQNMRIATTFATKDCKQSKSVCSIPAGILSYFK
jgi:hypothetical protein